MERRRFLRAAAAAGVPVALAGCTNDGGDGSDGGDGGDGGATPTATETATPTDAMGTEDDELTPTATEGSTATDEATPTESPTATDEPTSTATATPEPDQVIEVDPPEGRANRFVPDTFEIDAGDTVLWVWRDGGHNVSPGSQPSDANWAGDDETTYPEGHRYAHTFDVGGEYEYHCDPHQGLGMTGSFTVE